MGRSTKTSWLDGPGDLREADVEDVPVKGETVRVRGLPAAYSNEAQTEATELRVVGETQFVNMNKARLEVLQFAHGCVDPQFTIEEAEQIAQRYGPAFNKVIAKIDELSGLDKEAIEEATARFPSSGIGAADEGEEGPHGSPGGSRGPDLPARVGA